MQHILEKLTGRQVASLALCARYAKPGTDNAYGFAYASDGPALAALGLVTRLEFHGYRATAKGAAAVSGLTNYDMFAADKLGDISYSRRDGFEHAIQRAWVAPFAESHEIEKQIRAGA